MIFEGPSEVLLTFRRCPVDIYTSGQNGRYWSPYRLAPYNPRDNGDRRVNSSAFSFILDSGIGYDDLTNEALIERAETLDPEPEYIVPKDHLHDPDATTESVYEFLEIYEETSLTSEIIIPLQPTSPGSPDNPTFKSPNMDHADHYEDFRDLSGISTYGIGGVKDAETRVQLECVRSFREAVGEFPRGPRVHLFGVGASMEFVKAVRNDPRLVQSVDCATITRQLINNRLPDKYLNYSDNGFSLPRGDNSTTVLGQFIGAGITMLAYLMGPDLDDEDLKKIMDPDDGREQSGISDADEWGT